MIQVLEGKIEIKGQKFAVIICSGVGYRVFLGEETLKKIPEKPENVKLWTHLYVRENSLELYGFLHFAEVEFFEELLGISGVGPKSALGVLSVASLDTLKRAIASGDSSYLTKVSGIGRKTAEKIILELKERLAGKGTTVEAPQLKQEVDALDALVSLGYSQKESRDALQKISLEASTAEVKIKEALKILGKRN